MSRNIFLPLALTSLLLTSCFLFKHNHSYADDYVVMDSAADWENPPAGYDSESEWTGKNEILYTQYRGTRTKYWDLKHTELQLEFDFLKRQAKGKATLILSPHWQAMDSLVLDAKGFSDIEVNALDSQKSTHKLVTENQLRFDYSDSQHLVIYLAKSYNRQENLTLAISYTTNTYKTQSSSGGIAITDDRGLYFINHDLSDPTKPRQIWTQGETESTSRWFPTLDAPNQKTSLKITLTVPDTMVTLSNGLLLQSSASATKGFRTDVWEQKLPHAPYLTMIAIGNWAVIKDKWQGKEVNYLLEKEYAPYAPLIFGKTPAMMSFFSSYTGVAFPWAKYSQVVVRDFVSGAMENTTATVHMEQLQHTPIEHFDETYEDYISHELFHQWFGDLVTAESWSNITLNESFATYGQYLWREHQYGAAAADWTLDDFRNDYLNNWYATNKKLLRYDYDSPDEVFDNISYQKGACILHMLRKTIGEEAFRTGLKNYLQNNAFGSAEVAQLRLEFEKVTGTDLQWFFNQWYLDTDHPKLQLYLNSDIDGNWYLDVSQIQDHRNAYAFPFKVVWEDHSGQHQKTVFIETRNTIIELGNEKPLWLIPDADNALLAEFSMVSNTETETAEMIRSCYLGAQHSVSPGTQFNLFKMACTMADVDGSDESNRDIVEAFIPFFGFAGRSGYDFMVEKAIYFSNSHPEFPFFTKDQSDNETLLSIAKNKALRSDTRILALYAVSYQNGDQNTLANFTHDTSISVSIAALDIITEKSIWEPMVIKGMDDTRGNVAVAWARKSILEASMPVDLALLALAKNPGVTAESFYNFSGSIFYYAPEESLVASLKNSVQLLKTEGLELRLNLIKSRLANEISKLKQILPGLEESDPEYAETVTARIHDFEQMISEE